jgi:hypothetical protein
MRKPPGFIIPSEPVLAREIPPSTDYTAEIKWDGWRALLYKRAGSIALYSRTGKTLTDKFPAIAVAAKSRARPFGHYRCRACFYRAGWKTRLQSAYAPSSPKSNALVLRSPAPQ